MSDRWTSDPGLSGSEPLSPAEELDDLDDLEDELEEHPAEEPVVAHEEKEAGAGEGEPGEAEQHAAGVLDVPRDVNVLEGTPDGSRRGVAIVASRYNGEITNKLLNSALEELYEAGVRREAITVMPVPGAFELPLAAMALAKTRRYSCVVALGCIVRGETPHFDFIASEAASGLQLAALETGVPVAFGVLTVDVVEQAEARVSKGAEAVRTALEMADAFAQLRASARC